MSRPGFWMFEESGVLRRAVEAYLKGGPMTAEHIAAMRAYLRQWCNAPDFKGADVEELRSGVDRLRNRETIKRWLDKAVDAGIDPL